MPDDLKFHILTVNEAERYTLIKVEPDIPAASEEEDATVRERQTDAVTALAELDPRKDDVRRKLLKDTWDRLSGSGVDLQAVASILHRADRAKKTHKGERMLNKGMAASRVERDAAIRDLRASLARLLRWIRKCTPHWGRDMAFGVVLAAVKRLEQAVTSNAFLRILGLQSYTWDGPSTSSPSCGSCCGSREVPAKPAHPRRVFRPQRPWRAAPPGRHRPASLRPRMSCSRS